MTRALWLAVTALLVVAAGVGGYVVGSRGAPDVADAESVRADAELAARTSADAAAHAGALEEGRDDGVSEGEQRGRQAGADAGARAGSAASQEQLAAAAAEEAAAADDGLLHIPSGLEPTTLPNGEPGYALPLEERTLSCVGFEATTGQCVGD